MAPPTHHWVREIRSASGGGGGKGGKGGRGGDREALGNLETRGRGRAHVFLDALDASLGPLDLLDVPRREGQGVQADPLDLLDDLEIADGGQGNQDGQCDLAHPF